MSGLHYRLYSQDFMECQGWTLPWPLPSGPRKCWKKEMSPLWSTARNFPVSPQRKRRTPRCQRRKAFHGMCRRDPGGTVGKWKFDLNQLLLWKGHCRLEHWYRSIYINWIWWWTAIFASILVLRCFQVRCRMIAPVAFCHVVEAIFTYTWLMFMVNVGKYAITIHGCYGK